MIAAVVLEIHQVLRMALQLNASHCLNRHYFACHALALAAAWQLFVFVTVRCVALLVEYCFTLHCFPRCSIALRCVALHCAAFLPFVLPCFALCHVALLACEITNPFLAGPLLAYPSF